MAIVGKVLYVRDVVVTVLFAVVVTALAVPLSFRIMLSCEGKELVEAGLQLANCGTTRFRDGLLVLILES